MEKLKPCKFAVNPSGDTWECSCYRSTYCAEQREDRNPDGTLNIVICGYRPEREGNR